MATFSLYDQVIEDKNLTDQPIGMQITSKEYQHNIVTSKTNPLTGVLTRISGSSYTVDYYSQQLGGNTELRDFDPTQSSIYQQYRLVKQLELKLQSALSTDFSDKTQSQRTTGTAIIYPYLKPNKGDAFIGDIGDGRAGQFTVTNVTPKSMFKQACYEIDFELAREVNEDIVRDLNSKTVLTTHFVRDNLLNNTNPIITDEQFVMRENIVDAISDIGNSFLNEFYSLEHKTILVPNGGIPTYDPFMVRFVMSIMGVNDYPLIDKINLYNADDYRFTTYIDIYRAIMECEMYLLNENAFSRIQLVPTRAFSRNYMLGSIYFSGIQFVVLPLSDRYGIDDDLGIGQLSYNGFFEPNSDDKFVEGLGIKCEGTSNYIFSKDFYRTEKGATGNVEDIVKAYLRKDAVDAGRILKLLKNKRDWSKFQRFYYLPILVAILTSTLRGEL